MEIYEKEGRQNIFSWCPGIDKERRDPNDKKKDLPTAIEQMEAIAEMPFVKHCAMMPDAHTGMEMPIGGVVACDNIVVPNFVGVDIGCGMGAMKTTLTKWDIEDMDLRKEMLHSLGRGIPVGFHHNDQRKEAQLKDKYSDWLKDMADNTVKDFMDFDPVGGYEKAFFSQLGTLGGGNHFCEVQHDEDGAVWIMLHSGSRNIGKKVGDYFNAIAGDLKDKWYSSVDVPFLPVGTREGDAYLAWMNFALQFAFLNRKVMLEEVKRNLAHFFPEIEFVTSQVVEDTEDELINIHHNFASLENHMGKNYWVHRKGATKAFNNMTGIIPGSMGTNSYIVKGLGNKVSLMSCSHGAGRTMGRRDFSRRMKYSHAQIEKSLENVVHSEFGKFERGKDKGLLDVSEAPGAYKDIHEVIDNELDLIKTVVELTPMLCLKG